MINRRSATRHLVFSEGTKVIPCSSLLHRTLLLFAFHCHSVYNFFLFWENSAKQPLILMQLNYSLFGFDNMGYWNILQELFPRLKKNKMSINIGILYKHNS